jgi:glycosyltransferase involved in cell wall biosynthesis
MNILMIHPHDIYSSSEPWTTRVKNLAYQLTKKGNAVKLVYFPLEIADVNKESTDNGFQVMPLSRKLGILVLFKNIIKIVKLAGWADIIHFQKCYYYAALPALIASWLKNKPVHYEWDDWETKIFYYSNPRQRIVGEFINVFENLILKAVDTVSVSSGHLRKLCIKKGVAPEDIFSAPVGADLDKFKPCPESSNIAKKRYNIGHKLVLYIGQLHGGQYAELFIKAAGVVLRRINNITFMVIGDGYRLGELKELSGREGLNNHMIFTGSLSHELIPSYLNSADICVACFEDNDITRCKSPLKVAEYLACGKAIVASDIAEVRNMIKGVGILVKPGDYLSLAEGILKLTVDEELRKRLAALARKRAEEKYSWEITASSLLSAYNKYLNMENECLYKG